ncbi:hypothetical protein [Thiocapsa sp.]|uniref:hypothetical protein n=1 Tax=Thiocapsa sp. TaxID=2024551 RepID=UPI0025EEA554|nr:hypothetical protein [Thiocapsa sp.]
MPAANVTGSATGGSCQPTKIVFFGLGAVGSALLICLSELAERDDVPVRFVVCVVNPDAARDALFHAERIFDRIEFIGVPDFAPVFALEPGYESALKGAAMVVNAALPEFNGPVIETVGLSYLRYHDLLNTPYAGATYISYPTAVGAAILAWHALEYAREAPGALVGVVGGEDLARLLPRMRADAVRRDLVAWDIDLFESVRDASEA